MEKIELIASRRKIAKKAAKRLRSEGMVPGMLYGHGFENVALKIQSLSLNRILSQAGSSQLIHLRIDDSSTTQPVLAREIQRNVLTGAPIHVDFLAVSMTEKITAQVSLTLVGEPRPVTQGEGMLLHGAGEIEIECLPGDLIPSLEVDISDLDFDTAIYVSDLHLPANITILSDPQEMIAQLSYEQMAGEAEVEEEALFEEEPTKVEVISKGKLEEEEEA
jgi:large subunit ribosomal protein L25